MIRAPARRSRRVSAASRAVAVLALVAGGCVADEPTRGGGPTEGSARTDPAVETNVGATDAATGPRVLFVRGASGTGGFLEGGSDGQLSDVRDASTAAGNHGWATLAARLEENGFVVRQVVEGPGGEPADLSAEMLRDVDVLVLGSNNAGYDGGHVAAVVSWVRDGGGLLVISDANWGTTWSDAPSSDQPFLDPFDLTVNQDNGRYVIERRDFAEPDHPLLRSVDAFDGEGVSPFTVTDRRDDVDPLILARAVGEVRRPVGDPGPLTPATDEDAALVVASLGEGRMVGHFDRNTFFNSGGAGTDITRFDNAELADGVFDWLAQR